MKFLQWFSFRSFRYNFRNWLFPIFVIISGLLLLNVTLVMVSTGDSIIETTFLNNQNLKLLVIKPDRTTEKLLLRQIARNNNAEIVAFPYMKAINAGISFEKGDEMVQNFGVPLPYDALAVLGIDGISKERWDNGEVVIVPQTFADNFKITQGTKLSIPLQKTESLMAEGLSDDEFAQKLEQIQNNYQTREVEVVALDEIPLSKLPETGIIPLNLYYDVQATSSGKSVEEYIATESAQDGMGVLVKEFNAVERVAKDFTDRQYNVEYSLADFKNLSQIVDTLRTGMQLFIAVVSVITVVTIMNSLFQMFFYKRREIGLLMAMGIKKQVIVSSYIIEIIFQNLIVCLIIIPIVIVLQNIGLAQFSKLELPLGAIENMHAITMNNIYFNIIFVFCTTVIGSLLPFIRTFRNTIVQLINGA